MANQYKSDQPNMYQIKLKGHLGDQWSDWFDGAAISLNDPDETVLTCSVVDQSALHGLLRQIRDFGMPIISINQINNDAKDTPDETSNTT